MVDFKNLEPNVATLNHTSELGREMIPDAFLFEDDDLASFPHGRNAVTSSRGRNFDDHPIGPGNELDSAEKGSSDPAEGSRVSWP